MGPATIHVSTYEQSNGITCDCFSDLQCTSDAVFDDTFGASTMHVHGNRTKVPGMSSGCLPVSSMLASTLTCFYDQTCLDTLLSFFPITERFSAMVVDNKSRFSPTATIQSMVENLMIEEWIINISYENYYDQCAPAFCTYLKEERRGFLFVLTRLIGVLSGLTALLQLIIPSTVQLVLKRNKSEPSLKISIRIGMRQLKVKLKAALMELNLFKHDPSNDRQERYQRYATRLYLILIILSVVALTIYKMGSSTIGRRSFANPSLSLYIQLEETYSTSLSCPCSSISPSYATFVSFKIEYHPVCSSYLVTEPWFTYIRPLTIDDIGRNDYRYYGLSHFISLAMFCEQANRTINDSLNTFLKTPLVSSKVIRRDVLQSQMDASIQNWKTITINEFNRTLKLIQVTTRANLLMNGINIFIQVAEDGSIITEPRRYGECNCAFFTTCKEMMFAFDATGFAVVPNFYVGCYPFEALLESTLECFYNERCMIEVGRFFNRSFNTQWTYPALDANLTSSADKVHAIFDRMMLHSFSWFVNFTSYYTKCAPQSCTVEFLTRPDIFTVVIFVTGIFGGLLIGFKILILLGLRLIEKYIDHASFLLVVLSFKNAVQCENAKQLTQRLHLILVLITLLFIYVFFAFTPRLTTIEVPKPSLDEYEKLAKQYPDSLRCSCSEISSEYQSFLDITASFHPACSRNFAIELLVIVESVNGSDYDTMPAAYGYSGFGQLVALTSLCQLSQETLTDARNKLLGSHMITTELLSSKSLSQRISKLIDTFKINTPASFINTFALIRETTKANKLMNSFGSSWVFAKSPEIQIYDTLQTIPMHYGECNCALSSQCSIKLFGVKLGCYILENLLQSTFQCLYDQECVDRTNTFPALNNTVTPSRFPINATLESAFSELMIEQITYNLSYTKYFSRCAPLSCVFSYTDARNIVDGITILISLYGGLMIICRLIAVVMVKQFCSRTTRVIPMIDS